MNLILLLECNIASIADWLNLPVDMYRGGPFFISIAKENEQRPPPANIYLVQ